MKSIILLFLVAVSLVNAQEPVSNSPQNVAGKKAGERRLIEIIPGLKIPFRWCPATSADGFLMGSPVGENERKANETQHKVMIKKGFWIMEHEMTIEECHQIYKSFADKYVPRTKYFPSSKEFRGFPAGLLHFEFSTELISFVNKNNKLDNALTCALPSLAQWQYACRAGTTSAFSYGDSLDFRIANIDSRKPYNSKFQKKRPAGRAFKTGHYKPNAWGLAEMHGNLAELCRYERGPKATTEKQIEAAARYAQRRQLVLPLEWVVPNIYDLCYAGGSFSSAGKDCRSASFQKIPLEKENQRQFGLRMVLIQQDREQLTNKADLLKVAVANYAASRVYSNKTYSYKTKKLFEEMKQKGDPRAMIWLAILDYRGVCDTEKNTKAAVATAKKNIKKIGKLLKTDAEAQYLAGQVCEYGIGVKKNKKKAYAWYKKAAAMNHFLALNKMGLAYAKIAKTPQQLEKARQFFTRAQSQGSFRASYYLTTYKINTAEEQRELDKFTNSPLAQAVLLSRSKGFAVLAKNNIIKNVFKYVQRPNPGYDIYNFPKEGVITHIKDKELVYIALSNQDWKGISSYKKPLPYDLKWNMPAEEVKKLLGKPSRETMGHYNGAKGYQYEKSGLGTTLWFSREKSYPLSEIQIFRLEDS